MINIELNYYLMNASSIKFLTSTNLDPQNSSPYWSVL